MLANELADQFSDVRTLQRRHIGIEVTGELPERGRATLRLSLGPLKSAEGGAQGVAIVLDDLTERRKLEGQRRLFERMVSPAVIAELDPDSLKLGGQVREITTLFADLGGFTSFSESINPQDLVVVLNRYLASAAEVILGENGTIDKFQGDAIMAWFNAPVAQADHVWRAIRSAAGIRRSIKDLHGTLPPEFHLSFRVGIHTGEALLGLVGTHTRLDYTAIGDSVNTAKRLQEYAQADQILLSRQTYAQVRQRVDIKEVGTLILEGKSRQVEALELIGLRS
jgi:class 3 adenylate cyclase